METFTKEPFLNKSFGDDNPKRSKLLEDIAKLFRKKERQELTLETLTEAFKIDLPIFEQKIALNKKAFLSNESKKALLNQFVFDDSGKRTVDKENEEKRAEYDALDSMSVEIKKETEGLQQKIDAKKADINDVIRGINYITGLIGQKQEEIRSLEEK